MLQNQQDINNNKFSTFLIKRKLVNNYPSSLRNIFLIDKTKTIQNSINIKKHHFLNQFDICGDKEFKLKFMQQNQQQAQNQQNKVQQIKINEKSLRGLLNNQMTIQNFNNSENKKIQTIYMNDSHRQTYLSNLHKTQKNVINRQRKTLEKFKQTQKSWNNINTYLKLRIPKSQTLTFDSVKNIYIEQNPEKSNIINDMIPDYWKNSLKSNNKKLKSHLKGHQFKEEIAQQMLQTLKGTKKIELSIPKIGSKRVDRCLSKKLMKLKGKRVQKSQNNETMRQFQRNIYQTLNSTMRNRSFEKTTQQKEKTAKLFSINKTMQTKSEFKKDLTEELTEQQKKMLDFCTVLENLDHTDNQIYAKQYQRKRKWLYEGLQIFQ